MSPVDTQPSPTQMKPGPVCRVCPVYRRCQSTCEAVEGLLPSMERGRVDAEDLPRLYFGIQLTNALLDNTELLTPRQREVVRLYYRNALQQKEIAALLQVTQQAVNDSLQRARITVGRHLKKH